MDKRELWALISLLDDTDREIVTTVTGNLLKQGSVVIPELEKAWEGTMNETLQVRLENLIQEIQFNGVKDDLTRWIRTGAEYILEGAYYVAKFLYPEISMHKFSRNNTDFYSPQNSYINQVFETKKGNPISLSIVYLSAAWKLGLPIYGVNLPKNFILAYKDEFS